MFIINCNDDRGGTVQWRLGPRLPLLNYRPRTVPHFHNQPGSLTHLYFCSSLYLAPHTRYVGQQFPGGLKGSGGDGDSDPAIPSPFAFPESLRFEEGEEDAEATKQFTLQQSLIYETGDVLYMILHNI